MVIPPRDYGHDRRPTHSIIYLTFRLFGLSPRSWHSPRNYQLRINVGSEQFPEYRPAPHPETLSFMFYNIQYDLKSWTISRIPVRFTSPPCPFSGPYQQGVNLTGFGRFVILWRPQAFENENYFCFPLNSYPVDFFRWKPNRPKYITIIPNKNSPLFPDVEKQGGILNKINLINELFFILFI